MPTDNPASPLNYKGVMVSSTFTDLKEHREALIKAIDAQSLKSVAMEHDSAKPAGDVIDSSLQMVRDSSGYIGVISHKYGQIPECPTRNPNGLSLTELEFNEARRLDRPVLLFIMGDDHQVRPRDVESDPTKKEKLVAFRENAKRPMTDSTLHRIYKVFNDITEFTVAATQSIADLRRFLDEQDEPTAEPSEATPHDTTKTKPDAIPTPPDFYAEPAYIGSHKFVGRKSQLDILGDWAMPADAHPVLLFEAIGGAGKSMLTWEWATKHATDARDDWAGRFWYSFYEKGAIMADFCRCALAYMTGQPFKDFRKKKTFELGEQLLRCLQERPWLLILDGLERVLVAYQRFDAAQLRDEEADNPTDQIAHRDPCAAIRPEDDDLLRTLAGAAPSKLLITTRLTPRILLNPAGQPIPGVLRERLPGLRPADAEVLLRSCGVTGTADEMQDYLKSHCDCHPLVTGVLAGLINDYMPDRGNFDAWAADPEGGSRPNLAELDLVQRRNHILEAALDALSKEGRQLLSTLALLSEAVDYPILSAFNPHLRCEPKEVKEPVNPEKGRRWKRMSDEQKKEARQEYDAALERRREYEQAVKARLESPEFLTATEELTRTVRDLEDRGLLQYDDHTKRYDMHPVVRSVVSGGLRKEETERYGQSVVDHFSGRSHSPYVEAETLEDVRDGIHVVRTLLRMGRIQQAFDAYQGDLSNALVFNLEAYAEVLSLLRPFFPYGWAKLPDVLEPLAGSYLANDAGNALYKTGASEEALAAHTANLRVYLRSAHWRGLRATLSNIFLLLTSESRLVKEERCVVLAIDLAGQLDGKADLFRAHLDRFVQLSRLGQWTEAEEIWQLLDPMGRDWPRHLYRPGQAEYHYADFRFEQGQLTEEHLVKAEQLARGGKDRSLIRSLHGLRGAWELEQGRYPLAAESHHEAVRMAREVGKTDAKAETELAIARFHLGQLPDPRETAEQLAQEKKPFPRGIAELWLAIGDREQAKRHALAAYKWAWADGEPYVNRYELDKARALLEQLGAEIPDLPAYDASKDEKFPWEDEVAAAIEKLRAENEAKKRKKAKSGD